MGGQLGCCENRERSHEIILNSRSQLPHQVPDAIGNTFDESVNLEQTHSNPATRRLKQVLSFKDFKGFKKIDDIKKRYKIGRMLGEGSFGTVRIALHR